MKCKTTIFRYTTFELDQPASVTFINLIHDKPDMAVTPDKSVLMVTTTYSKDGNVKGLRHYSDTATNGGDVLLMKFDSTGHIIWKKCLGGSKDDKAGAVIAINDGYIVSGTTKSNDGDFTDPNPNLQIIFVVKLDFNGNIIWKKLFFRGYGNSNLVNEVEQIKRSPDGSFWILMNSASNGYHINLFNMQANGDSITSQQYFGNVQNIAASIEVNTDSTIYMSGYTANTVGAITTPFPQYFTGFICLLKRSNNFLPVWTKNLWFTNVQNTKILKMVRTRSGNIYAAGFFYASGDPKKAIIYKCDADGNQIWRKTFDQTRIIFDIDTTENEGLVMLTPQIQNPPGINLWGDADIFLTRLDSAGNIQWKKQYIGVYQDYALKVKHVQDNQMYVLSVTESDSLNPPNHNPHIHTLQPSGQPYFPTDMWVMLAGPNNSINGKVFFDIDKNGTYSPATEPLVSNIWVRTGKDSIHTIGVRSDGNFSLGVDTGRFITKAVIPVVNSGLFTTKPDTAVFTTRGNVRTTTLAIQSTADVYDADIDITPYSFARLGAFINYNVTYRNKGSLQLSGTNITVVKDSRLSFISAAPAPSQINGDTLRWNIGILPILANRNISLTFKSTVPPALNIGDTLRLSAKIAENNTDANPVDNEKKIEHIVIGSFDPNEKSEIHNGKLFVSQYNNGEYLNYKIHFQNTGTDTAFYIEVRDTLDSKLAFDNVIFTGSSHNCTITVLNNRVLVWKFDNIYLPPKSISDSMSQGFITFRIKPNSGLPVGDSVKNGAAIYFDYNDPVITNKTTTVISANIITPVNNIYSAVKNITVFPNPANQPKLQLVFKGNRSEKFDVTLLDAAGRVVLKKASVLMVPNQAQSFPLNNLSRGTYFVHLSNATSYSISKLVYAGN